MSLLAIIDTETTGLDIKKDFILEIGCALFDTERGSIISYHSDIISWPYDIKITQTITDLTGITNEMIFAYGVNARRAFEYFIKYAHGADYLVGHNIKNYDMPLLEMNLKYLGLNFSLPLIDSMVDLPNSKLTENKKLKYMAFEHGYIMNKAHRVIDDIQAVSHLMSFYPFEEIEKRSKAKEVTIVAKVKYEDRLLAKNAGFHWNVEKKHWYRTVKEFEFDEIVNTLEFSFEHNWHDRRQLNLFSAPEDNKDRHLQINQQ